MEKVNLSENNIYVVTSNTDKFNEIKFYLENELRLSVNVKNVKIEIKEIQGESEEIVTKKCKEASNLIEGVVIVEDTSFCVDCMNGLPGPYIRDFFLKLGNRKFYSLINSFANSKEEIKAEEKCSIAISRNFNDEILVFEGSVIGNIVEPDNAADDEYNWCFFFKPEGSHSTYGKMTVEEKCLISARKTALSKLGSYLIKNQNYLFKK